MSGSRPKRYTNWYLREWMRTQSITQAGLVDKTGLNKTTISLLTNDRQDYTPALIRDLARALNIAAYELLMHPDEAMALRRLQTNALSVVENSQVLHSREKEPEAAAARG